VYKNVHFLLFCAMWVKPRCRAGSHVSCFLLSLLKVRFVLKLCSNPIIPMKPLVEQVYRMLFFSMIGYDRVFLKVAYKEALREVVLETLRKTLSYPIMLIFVCL